MTIMKAALQAGNALQARNRCHVPLLVLNGVKQINFYSP